MRSVIKLGLAAAILAAATAIYNHSTANRQQPLSAPVVEFLTESNVVMTKFQECISQPDISFPEALLEQIKGSREEANQLIEEMGCREGSKRNGCVRLLRTDIVLGVQIILAESKQFGREVDLMLARLKQRLAQKAGGKNETV